MTSRNRCELIKYSFLYLQIFYLCTVCFFILKKIVSDFMFSIYCKHYNLYRCCLNIVNLGLFPVKCAETNIITFIFYNIKINII